MLLSVLCSDELGVLWSYFVDRDEARNTREKGVLYAPEYVDALRDELAAVKDRRNTSGH
jgi:hypothetical protein